MRCALYARYSSDQQREASIEDQLRICRVRAEREGWTVVEVFTDAALSGASLLRPGYQALLAAMRAGSIDLVLAESLDRFSRDQEHIAGFFKQARFAGVQVVTLAEGEISELHIGLKGTMGALYLKDLADKTRRGLEGRIKAGRAVGEIPYGYRKVIRLGADGEPERGLREIDAAEAAVIRRIFADYAAGHSPRHIAMTLNAEGVTAPGGGIWYDSSIRGRPRRGDGLLRNQIYAGRLVWNRRRSLKDPITGKQRRRNNNPSDFVIQPVPDLRIVDDALWERVQIRLAADAASPAGPSGKPAYWLQRRPQHLLSGKVVCGSCGALFEVRTKDYLGCRHARQGACGNRDTVRRTPLEQRVCEALGRQLMQPELMAYFVAEFTAEWNRMTAEAGAAAEGHRRELRGIERQIANLVDAIADGLASPGLRAKLDGLETRKAELARVTAATPHSVPALHPNLAKVYRKRVATLHDALSAGDAPDALEAARALVDRVVIYPPGDGGGPPGVELIGDLLAMLRAGGLGEAGDQDVHATGVLAMFASSVKEGQGGYVLPGL